MEKKTQIKVVAPVDLTGLAKGEPVAIKGTLYVQPNGDQFFEAAENSPKNVSKKNGYKFRAKKKDDIANSLTSKCGGGRKTDNFILE